MRKHYQLWVFSWQLFGGLLLAGTGVRSDDFASLCAGRTAVERVYYHHRLGQKTPFEQVSPPPVIERLVRDDLHKEATLRKVYGVEISPAQLDAELQRIDTTTRAPEMLAEIKAALGNHRETLARVFAKPVLVERLLRERFENDDALHAPQRRIAETLRGQLLAIENGGGANRLAALQACQQGELQEQLTWELTPRPATDAPAVPTPPAAPTANKAAAGPYAIEATAQLAQVLSPPETLPEGKPHKLYFEDLPTRLQELFHAQLQRPGDVSAVIETPGNFQIYLARERTPKQLAAAVFTLRKRSYEEWLGQQPAP